MEKLTKILRILTIILYLLLNIAMIYVIITQGKYFTIMDKTTALNTILLFFITLLIPSILILALFIKKDKTILKIGIGVIQFILLAILPFVFIFGLILSLRMPSYTTNPGNYENRDEYVDSLLEQKEFDLLPTTLPNEITDVSYLYNFESIFDDNYLSMETSWTYKDESDYQYTKNQMQSYQPINNQGVEDGFNMIYAVGNHSDEDKYFRFGYDDATRRVTYRIYYEWR